MARVSRFSEDLADTHAARQRPCPSSDQKTGKRKTTTATALKSLITKPWWKVRALARCYKEHLSLMITTNNTSPNPTDHTSAVEAGSRAYGVRAASDEELRRQSERNHLDYVFYLGPDVYNNTTTTVPSSGMTTATTATATVNSHVHDVRASWHEAYMCPSAAASTVHRIDEACNGYFGGVGAMPVMLTITEEREYGIW